MTPVQAPGGPGWAGGFGEAGVALVSDGPDWAGGSASAGLARQTRDINKIEFQNH
jgi:hypothetical protein